MNQFLNKQLQSPAFAAEYEALQSEYEAIRAIIGARIESNMTQKQLAEKTSFLLCTGRFPKFSC